MKKTMFHSARHNSLPLLVALGALVAGCGKSEPTNGKKPAEQPAALKLLIVDQPQLAAAIERVREEWHTQSGSTLEVVEMTVGEVASAEKLVADAIIYSTPMLGTLAEKKFIRPLLPRWLESEKFNAADLLQPADAPEFCWDGQPYAISLGQSTLVLVYRADILERLGKSPPTTWGEYRELFKSLEEMAEGAKIPPIINVEPIPTHFESTTLLARAAAYARHRDYFSVLFDRETMEPLIAGPPFVRALVELVSSESLKHDLWNTVSAEDTIDLVVSDQAVMGIALLAIANPAFTEARANGVRIAVASLPGSREAFNPRNQQWEVRRDDESKSVPVRGGSGLVGSIARGTTNADAAFVLLTWLTTDPWDRDLVLATNGGIPFRKSHAEFLSQRLGPHLGESGARQLWDVLTASLNQPTVVFVPRLPGQQQYIAALDEAVITALSGDKSPQAALDTAAKKWREITARLGKDEQLAAYRRSLKGAE